jgi:effector-binding domain-containing protein
MISVELWTLGNKKKSQRSAQSKIRKFCNVAQSFQRTKIKIFATHRKIIEKTVNPHNSV